MMDYLKMQHWVGLSCTAPDSIILGLLRHDKQLTDLQAPPYFCLCIAYFAN